MSIEGDSPNETLIWWNPKFEDVFDCEGRVVGINSKQNILNTPKETYSTEILFPPSIVDHQNIIHCFRALLHMGVLEPKTVSLIANKLEFVNDNVDFQSLTEVFDHSLNKEWGQSFVIHGALSQNIARIIFPELGGKFNINLIEILDRFASGEDYRDALERYTNIYNYKFRLLSFVKSYIRKQGWNDKSNASPEDYSLHAHDLLGQIENLDVFNLLLTNTEYLKNYFNNGSTNNFLESKNLIRSIIVQELSTDLQLSPVTNYNPLDNIPEHILNGKNTIISTITHDLQQNHPPIKNKTIHGQIFIDGIPGTVFLGCPYFINTPRRIS